MRKYDVIIIGGGPAGCSMAMDLNRRGYDVALCDQSRFPRDKVCGEFISPGADPILAELGVLHSIEALNPKRLKGVAISSYESEELKIDYPPFSETGLRPASLSVPRFQLDALFLEQVKKAGVEVFEQHKAMDFIFESGCVSGVQGWDETKTRFSLNARLVVDAGGRNALSLKKFDLKVEPKSSMKIAFSAHWRGVNLSHDYCYMHVSRPGYTGISSVGNEKTNVVLVVDRSAIRNKDFDTIESVEEFYYRILMKNRRRQKILENGERIEPVRSIESLAFKVKPVPCGGLVLVGDAMGFVDPFTGEGIYLSIRSSQLAGEVIHDGFRRSDFSRKVLFKYELNRQEEFGGKILLSRVLQWLIHNQRFCNRVLNSLSMNRGLAETLAGVIGDILPAKKVVSIQFLVSLFKGAFYSDSVKQSMHKTYHPPLRMD